jgi:hypothetical protein
MKSNNSSSLTLDEQIFIIQTPLPEQPLELVMKALPGLTRKEAVARMEHSRKIRVKMAEEGRCPECGDSKHKGSKCPLKTQADKETIKALMGRYVKA